ncbi:glucose-6-phosphate exchanger SLC37A2 isoform X2 [Phlebotomus argentipes]|uniref:glucose-6-phosphate exchanger SLC37A2 isoform X2 n=1 Tax=Phlebotomus argentipes TaxID=94469 RepID=UPI0028935E60|nr:glucose-6-phosphate exchanger SLC37A2 isoform X2 [Phlebotomus argentipes]
MRFAWRRCRMSNPDVPIGVRSLQFLSAHLCPRLRINRPLCFRFSVLALTYIAYCCYHLTRKPISVVKSVLHRNCSTVALPKGVLLSDAIDNSTWCDYPPFDGPNASALFGTLDSAFLFCYAAAMFASGFIAERVSLRYFLTFGMLFSGIFCYLFGVAKTYGVHSMAYFVFVQAMAGIFQTTGWPGVVTVVGRWFGKSKRGLIFGIWNSHTSIGNILGSLIAANYVESDWSRSFIVPGLIMGVCGFILFLFLVDSPDSVGCTERHAERRRDQYSRVESNDSTDDSEPDDTDIIVGEQEVTMRANERSPMLGGAPALAANHEAIGFGGALRIPGVVEFSLCLFFSKLVSYTFLYWLPLYIQSSTTLGAELSADLSTLFDVGGIIGAIAAGILSDYTNMPASTCSGMLAVAVPMLLVYQHWGTLSLPVNILLLFVVGILVNGPYALITTSVSAELGQHSCLEGNSKALATVTAIIDGTGSIGAAVGPLLAGLVSTSGWENVFYMLMISDVVALLLLVRLVMKEFKRRKRNVRIE